MSIDSLNQPTSLLCKNCGAPSRGNYCQECGQTTHLHVPSAREFVHEFVAHYVALEGKLWRSLGKLIFKPGLLTCEYINGRRVRYLEPLRLYLTFSIIFFALFKFSGIEIVGVGEDKPALAVIGVDTRTGAKPMMAGTPEHTAELKRSMDPLVSRVTAVNTTLGQKIQHFLDLPRRTQEEAFKRAFFSYAPYAIFALMPVFAFYLRILYIGTGRRYGEHFLFGLHSNAFAFLMFSVLLLVPSSWEFVRFLLTVWLVFYVPIAMRRVYGGGRLATGARWIVLMLLHLLSLIGAIVVAMAQALMG